MDLETIIESSAYFLALINPASKIFLLSTMDPPYTRRQLWNVSVRSTLVALAILIVLIGAGSFLFHAVFRVEIYSLTIAGGVVLFTVGLRAVQKGRFYEESEMRGEPDITVVPLAAPLIAGPGTIAAAISFSTIYGAAETLLYVSLALLVNLLLMMTSRSVGRFLERFNATGPLIRITGLIVMAVAVQMIFTGITTWVQTI
ncbi:MAG: MarC family protein [Candidatus Hydrogenedentes bacterium]|nr:MarC family protein [Candidatus Hydrogenedentota bacterium]